MSNPNHGLLLSLSNLISSINPTSSFYKIKPNTTLVNPLFLKGKISKPIQLLTELMIDQEVIMNNHYNQNQKIIVNSNIEIINKMKKNQISFNQKPLDSVEAEKTLRECKSQTRGIIKCKEKRNKKLICTLRENK